MDKAASDKTSVRLSIFNQTFSLLVSGDPAEMESAAHDVDRLMSTIARSGNMETLRVAILACLHLQDRVHVLEREFEDFRGRVNTRGKTLADILDRTILPDSNSPTK